MGNPDALGTALLKKVQIPFKYLDLGLCSVIFDFSSVESLKEEGDFLGVISSF